MAKWSDKWYTKKVGKRGAVISGPTVVDARRAEEKARRDARNAARGGKNRKDRKNERNRAFRAAA